MNPTTNLRYSQCARWTVVIGALVATFTACGNESINVLTPRDAAVEAGPIDPMSDVSLSDAPPVSDVSVSDVPVSDVPVSDVSVSDVSVSDVSVSDASADMRGAADGSTAGCLPLGAQCSFAGKCCTLSCPTGTSTCVDTPKCTVAGEGCASNTDCCANFCSSSQCVGVVGGCRPAGELCDFNDQCCGGVCTSDPGGPTRCRPLGDCRVLGEVCVEDSDCCSGRCTADGTNVRRVCTVAPPCGLSGKRCQGQYGDRCVNVNDCCSGPCASGAEGVLRCSKSGTCNIECALCAEGRDCCSGSCVVDENGYRHCQ